MKYEAERQIENMGTNIKEDVIISIIVLTYNHEKYVQKALDSIFMQDINVNYEVIIHDDVSKDSTQEILKAYAKKYPDKIRLYLRRMKAKSVTYIGYQMIKRAKGQYIAFLDGDDYWTDKGKLQRQYDFLEEHKEYIGSTHSNCVVNEAGKEIWNRALKVQYNWHGEYTIENYWYANKMPGHIGTLLCRNVFDGVNFSIMYKAHDMMGDMSIYLALLSQGIIYRLDDEMSARRYVTKKGKDNWNSIVLSRDARREHLVLQIKQLYWYETETGNYNMTRERWKIEQKWVWEYIKDCKMKKGIILFGIILRCRFANYIGCSCAKDALKKK